jgi:hypothetical protein
MKSILKAKKVSYKDYAVRIKGASVYLSKGSKSLKVEGLKHGHDYSVHTEDLLMEQCDGRTVDLADWCPPMPDDYISPNYKKVSKEVEEYLSAWTCKEVYSSGEGDGYRTKSPSREGYWYHPCLGGNRTTYAGYKGYVESANKRVEEDRQDSWRRSQDWYPLAFETWCELHQEKLNAAIEGRQLVTSTFKVKSGLKVKLEFIGEYPYPASGTLEGSCEEGFFIKKEARGKTSILSVNVPEYGLKGDWKIVAIIE